MTPALYSWTFIPREVKAYVHNNLYVNVHSSLIGNNLNLETTQCPLVGGWSNNSGTSMPQNYLAIIRNKQMISTSAWIDLEGIMWGKKSQMVTQCNSKYNILKVKKSYRNGEQMSDFQGTWMGLAVWMWLQWYCIKKFLWVMEPVYILIVEQYISTYEIKLHRIVYRPNAN